MNPPIITETIREFIKEAELRNDSLFISRKKLQRFISTLNTSPKDGEFSNENELIVAIYVLLKSYQMYDKYNVWSKEKMYKYLKEQREKYANTDDIFTGIDIIQEILKMLFSLDIEYKTDKEIITIINNTLFKKEKQIIQNLKDLEKLLNIENTLINANIKPQQIYETLQKKFEEKEKKTNSAETLTPTEDKTIKNRNKRKVTELKGGERQKSSPIKRKNLLDSEEKSECIKEDYKESNDNITEKEARMIHKATKRKKTTFEDLLI